MTATNPTRKEYEGKLGKTSYEEHREKVAMSLWAVALVAASGLIASCGPIKGSSRLLSFAVGENLSQVLHMEELLSRPSPKQSPIFLLLRNLGGHPICCLIYNRDGRKTS